MWVVATDDVIRQVVKPRQSLRLKITSSAARRRFGPCEPGQAGGSLAAGSHY